MSEPTNEELLAEIRTLRTRLDRIETHGRTSAIPDADAVEKSPVSRRALFGIAGAGVAGAAVLHSAAPAAAASTGDGEALTAGDINIAQSETTLQVDAATTSNQDLLTLRNNDTGNTGAVLEIDQNSASGKGIDLQHDGSGEAIDVSNNGTGRGINVEQANSGEAIRAVNTSTGSGINTIGTAAQTSANINSATAGSVAAVAGSNTGAGVGVSASAVGGNAVSAASVTGAGVSGSSTTGAGVTATSTSGVGVSATSTSASAVAATTAAADAPAINAINTDSSAAVAGEANAIRGENTGAANGSHAVLGITAGIGHSVAGDTTNAANTVAATWGRHAGIGAGAEGHNVGTGANAGPGTVGLSDEGLGLVGNGGLAPLRLVPAIAATAAPASGAHKAGEFYVDVAGDVFYCSADGTPGTWTQLNGGGGGEAGITLLATPQRAFDSRAGKAPTSTTPGIKGPFSAAETRVIDLNGATSLPTTATAAVVNLTLAGTTGSAGFASVYSGSAATVAPPTFSQINWFGPNQIIANMITTAVSATQTVKVYTSGATEVILDVIGYY